MTAPSTGSGRPAPALLGAVASVAQPVVPVAVVLPDRRALEARVVDAGGEGRGPRRSPRQLPQHRPATGVARGARLVEGSPRSHGTWRVTAWSMEARRGCRDVGRPVDLHRGRMWPVVTPARPWRRRRSGRRGLPRGRTPTWGPQGSSRTSVPWWGARPLRTQSRAFLTAAVRLVIWLSRHDLAKRRDTPEPSPASCGGTAASTRPTRAGHGPNRPARGSSVGTGMPTMWRARRIIRDRAGRACHSAATSPSPPAAADRCAWATAPRRSLSHTSRCPPDRAAVDGDLDDEVRWCERPVPETGLLDLDAATHQHSDRRCSAGDRRPDPSAGRRRRRTVPGRTAP